MKAKLLTIFTCICEGVWTKVTNYLMNLMFCQSKHKKCTVHSGLPDDMVVVTHGSFAIKSLKNKLEACYKYSFTSRKLNKFNVEDSVSQHKLDSYGKCFA